MTFNTHYSLDEEERRKRRNCNLIQGDVVMIVNDKSEARGYRAIVLEPKLVTSQGKRVRVVILKADGWHWKKMGVRLFSRTSLSLEEGIEDR